MRSLATRFLCSVFLIALSVTEADAQTRVRVVRDGAAIWTRTFLAITMVVGTGLELEVVRSQEDWLEVVLPYNNPRRLTGFIARVNVEAVAGSTPSPPAPRPRSEVSRPRPAPSGPEPPPRVTTSQPVRTTPRASRGASGLRGFGQIGVGSFLASDSFRAVFGDAAVGGLGRGPWYGGGAQFQTRSGWFVEGAITRLRQTGERVFIFDDTVFALGIPNALSITPITATAGYRVAARRAAPFIGGGLGRYFVSERTPFDDASERKTSSTTSYHLVGGVEFPVARAIGMAVQAQYTRVPDGLTGGVATLFNESDLGGIQLGLKVLVGR